MRKDKNIQKLLSGVLLGLMTINVVAQAESARPKLVVGIVVDQLRTDYIEYLKDLFGEKGFKRLMKNGVYLQNVDFRAEVNDAPTATGMIYTGNYPARTGIPETTVYDPESGLSTHALRDTEYIGNFTDNTLSPRNLRLSTISDELAIDGGGLGLIYAVSADPQQAVIMAGHAGNSALWIDKNTGNWCSSTYYKDFPQRISNRNRRTPLSSRIDTICWRPALPMNLYPGLPAQKRIYPFSHTYPRSDREVYSLFATTPPGNNEVTDVAIDCIVEQNLGNRGDVIDMLNVAYSAAPYKYIADNDFRPELEDTYIRLDAQLGRLFDEIDKRVGLDNTFIFLSSTGYCDNAIIPDSKYRIPTGEVSLKRLESLLNSFLSAKYGNGDYIKGIHSSYLYLDHSLLDRKGLSIDEIGRNARDFIIKMSGISDVRTLSEILSDTSAGSEALRLSIDPRIPADLMLTFTPGWTVTDDRSYPPVKRPIGSSPVTTPAFILSPSLKATTVSTPVKATALAPTVSSELHIRSPNGAIEKRIVIN